MMRIEETETDEWKVGDLFNRGLWTTVSSQVIADGVITRIDAPMLLASKSRDGKLKHEFRRQKTEIVWFNDIPEGTLLTYDDTPIQQSEEAQCGATCGACL